VPNFSLFGLFWDHSGQLAKKRKEKKVSLFIFTAWKYAMKDGLVTAAVRSHPL